jgi:hypothetical protein
MVEYELRLLESRERAHNGDDGLGEFIRDGRHLSFELAVCKPSTGVNIPAVEPASVEINV